MSNNARSPQVAEIRDLLSGRRAQRIFPHMGDGEAAARAGMILSDTYRAATLWRDLVRTNARWDHKPVLRRMLTLGPDFHFPIEGDADHEYYYDIWSNIHYGYVGAAAGFTDWMLQWGAARGGAAGTNDPVDVETIQIGIDLWNRYELNLTQQQLREEVLSRRQRILALQQTPAYQAAAKNFRHVTPVTDGQ
jgi:hypothetical protein